VVTVTGGSNKRVSLAALIGKAGQRLRLVYRVWDNLNTHVINGRQAR
jgi:hypothetical protein